eukprot:gnl/MRDRNA2_/MRDRNA2_75090_c1_seq1.p1 gnl/MRDRNA2_/MRDRNA2_75090_c1~~gnl/MRDRNA2_/MRDRNA2_75090_c1_seq1.p1  ORF type:complete len:390 (-),score=93.09 gnl/MRDRNA2_/MRDRNA2_75090_c1_seq1:152-1321(-)
MKRSYASYAEQSYRFKVGTQVLCNTQNGYEPGRIVAHNYVLPGDYTVHPYQVQLDCGRLIYCPLDEDLCIKEHIIAWWEELMSNLMARDDLNDQVGAAMLKKFSNGKDVNQKNHEGDACLHECLAYDWFPGVKALLELHADPNLGGEKEQRPLNMAVQLRLEKGEAGESEAAGLMTAKMLLEARADPSLQDEDPEKDPNFASKSFEERKWHRSALHYAAMSSKDLTMILLEARANVNQADAQWKQPLHLAIDENLPDVVDLLLANGADVHAGNIDIGLNSTPLVETAYKGDISLLKKLIHARSDINFRGKQGMTPLHMAARGRHLEAAQILLEARADTNIEVNGKTAAQLAARNGATELASMLRGRLEATGEQKTPMLDAEVRKQLYLD